MSGCKAGRLAIPKHIIELIDAEQPQRRLFWSDEETNIVRACIDKGLSVRQCEKIMAASGHNRTQSAIWTKWREMK